MSSGSNLGFFVLSFPANSLFAKLLHNFSAHGKQLESFTSETIAIEAVGEEIPSNLCNTSPSQGIRFFLASCIHYGVSRHVARLILVVVPECITADGGCLKKQQSLPAGACHSI